MSGRCICDATVRALVAAGGLPKLRTLVLSGLYRLSDVALQQLLRASPQLINLELPQVRYRDNLRSLSPSF